MIPKSIESAFDGASVFVTGATGLIGTALCRRLVSIGAKVVALVRNRAKADERLPKSVELLDGDVTNALEYAGDLDYIVHAAGTTASIEFVEHPVEIIEEIVDGAKNVLALAKDKKVKGVVLLSTMEIYGLTDSEDVHETSYASLDSMSHRNCYPEAKRLAECLFASAAKEYGIPTKVARLTQTFGAGVEIGDQRVFAQFARAAKSGSDIILKSEGKTARCYCSINDAVDAILAIAAKGNVGMAYNVANPDTYCTIRDMAEFVAKRFTNDTIKVRIAICDGGKNEYLPPFRMKLNVDRLASLGWKPTEGLYEMYSQII